MKTLLIRVRLQQGNTLLVTVVVTAVIGLMLLAYLSLVQFQNTSNVRSQAWNSAIPVVEAGLEEALAHLNTRAVTNGTLACDGWVESGGTYTMTRTLGDSFYSVTITNYAAGTTNRPVIESKGYSIRPTVFASGQGPFLAAAVALNGTYEYLGRGVRARTQKLAIFSKGLVAKDSIDMNGNNVSTDSFDSMDALYSTNGLYISTRTKDGGDVAVNASLTNSLNIGNANIRGRVAVGPGGTIAVGSQGAVGSAAWIGAGNNGIEPGWSGNDMNVSFDDVVVPFSGGVSPLAGYYSVVQSVVYPIGTTRVVRTNWVTTPSLPAGTPLPITTNGNGGSTTYTYKAFVYITPTNSSGTYYKYVLENGNYEVSPIGGLDGKVLVLGDANLFVAGSACNISGLTIEWGRHLDLYSSAPSATLTGNSTANSDGTADSFAFWGTTNCTSITLNGNASFTGTIYAPSADFVMNGGGNNTVDFIGASITKTARLNGHFNFHYDEALKNFGPSRGFIVSSWNEMLPAEIPPASSIPH
jgi:hypothetical protein